MWTSQPVETPTFFYVFAPFFVSQGGKARGHTVRHAKRAFAGGPDLRGAGVHVGPPRHPAHRTPRRHQLPCQHLCLQGDQLYSMIFAIYVLIYDILDLRLTCCSAAILDSISVSEPPGAVLFCRSRSRKIRYAFFGSDSGSRKFHIKGFFTMTDLKNNLNFPLEIIIQYNQPL